MPLHLNVLLISEEQKAAVRACTVVCPGTLQGTAVCSSLQAQALLSQPKPLSKITDVFMSYFSLYVRVNKHFIIINAGNKCVVYLSSQKLLISLVKEAFLA